METDLIDKLAAMCEKHVGNSNDVVFKDVVFPEPYVPYIPGGWNGVLVVAEAQNLSQKNAGYVQKLRDLASPQARIRRLQLARLHPEGGIGVQPWDDGLLPLAVEAALKVDLGLIRFRGQVGYVVPSLVSMLSAMAAGVTDHVWEIGEIVDLLCD